MQNDDCAAVSAIMAEVISDKKMAEPAWLFITKISKTQTGGYFIQLSDIIVNLYY